MRISVPSRIRRPRFSGLGDDPTGLDTTVYDPTTDLSVSLPTSDLQLLNLPTIAPPTNIPASAPYGYDELGNPLTAPATISASSISTTAPPTPVQLASVITKGTASGLSAQQIQSIIANAANAGVSIFRATSSPSLIPGTSLVYNPATGQIANATTGLTGSQLAAGLGGVSISTMVLLGGGALLLILLLKK